jgi:phenylpyruvate tautomerase PptA (4-oxalocrotonate tautomerase family)
MPYIRIYSYSGRDLEAKKKAAEAIVKAASEAMGAPEQAFTVTFEDIEREDWEKDIAQGVIEPIRDKLFIERGELVK